MEIWIKFHSCLFKDGKGSHKSTKNNAILISLFRPIPIPHTPDFNCNKITKRGYLRLPGPRCSPISRTSPPKALDNSFFSQLVRCFQIFCHPYEDFTASFSRYNLSSLSHGTVPRSWVIRSFFEPKILKSGFFPVDLS